MKAAICSVAACALVALLGSASGANAVGFTHVNCSGAESPVVQSAIHETDKSQGTCQNYSTQEWEQNPDLPWGHTQSCYTTYIGGRSTSLECNSTGCDIWSVITCAGQNITAHVHCPRNMNGTMPSARGNGTYATCSSEAGTNTCSCTNSSGCSAP